MSLDVTDIVNDPDFATTFQVFHETGYFADDGTWTTEEEPTDAVGIILPAAWDVLQQLPEGERNKETIVIYSSQEIRMGDQASEQADVIRWGEGRYYRVFSAKYYPQASVWFAIAVRFRRVD